MNLIGNGNACTLFTKILCDDYGADRDAVREAWSEVEIKYNQLHRYYHTVEHIDEVVTFSAMLCNGYNNFNEVILAGIFHDVIYDTRRSDNEDTSAEFAVAMVTGLCSEISYHVVDRMEFLIRGTKEHKAGYSRDAAVLFDADLMRLASTPEDFDLHSRQIRKEYCWVSQEDFTRARSEILQRFLNREHIYHLPKVRLACEPLARRNLTQSINKADYEHGWR